MLKYSLSSPTHTCRIECEKTQLKNFKWLYTEERQKRLCFLNVTATLTYSQSAQEEQYKEQRRQSTCENGVTKAYRKRKRSIPQEYFHLRHFVRIVDDCDHCDYTTTIRRTGGYRGKAARRKFLSFPLPPNLLLDDRKQNFFGMETKPLFFTNNAHQLGVLQLFSHTIHD